MIHRGDVVVVQFPYVSGARGKTRPAVVIQADRNNGRLLNTIVARITGNVRLASQAPTQVLIDPTTPAGSGSGLRYVSAIKCENLFTIAQADIQLQLGRLSAALLKPVEAALKAFLDLQ